MARCTVNDLRGKINRLNNNMAASKNVKKRHEYVVGHDGYGYHLRYKVGDGYEHIVTGNCSAIDTALTAVNKILEEEVE